MNPLKKSLSLIVVLIMTVSCMCIGASAAGGTAAGIYDVKTYTSGVSVTPKQADGTTNAVLNADGVYVDAARVTVTFSGATAGKYYLVITLNEDSYPTADNLAYMDQVVADTGTSVSFDVYPKELKSGQIYNIYVSSNDGVNAYHKVASFSYYTPYILGDVNEDGKVQSVDALRVLRAVAKQITLTSPQELAADVNHDNKIQSVDALRILRYVAKQITEF